MKSETFASMNAALITTLHNTFSNFLKLEDACQRLLIFKKNFSSR